jgi:hypothetical protein
MRNDPSRLLVSLSFAIALTGCGSWQVPTNLNGNIPAKGSAVPPTTLVVTPSLSIPLEKMVFWGAYAGVAYLILDPWAPNWDIEEAKFPGDHYKMSLHMKRYYTGGAGEARAVFHRRAKELVQAGGYDGYEVVEYTEGLESSVLGSRRVAEGVIVLTKRDG